jgi:hypothetical protein
MTCAVKRCQNEGPGVKCPTKRPAGFGETIAMAKPLEPVVK